MLIGCWKTVGATFPTRVHDSSSTEKRHRLRYDQIIRDAIAWVMQMYVLRVHLMLSILNIYLRV